MYWLLAASITIAFCLFVFLGAACRTRVVLTLRKKYSTPQEAEKVMCTQPFSLIATLKNMELADISVSKL